VELLERERELEAIDAALARAAAGEGGLLLVEGEAGIGKTTLLDATVVRARALGFTVGQARGSELESRHSFGLVRQLLGRLHVARAAAVAAGAAALADRVFAEVSAIPFEPMPPHRTFATMHGLYWTCADLAVRSPLLLAVDDAQWGDAESLQFLGFLARRLDGVAALAVLTSRPAHGPEAAGAPASELPVSDSAVVHPRVLSPTATGRFIELGTGTTVDPAFFAAAHAVTAGNPFLVRELVAETITAAIPTTAAGAEHVRALGPVSVAEATAARLRRLGPAAAALAHAAAILDRDATVARCATLAGTALPAATAAADDLIRTGVMADVQPLAFVHPLVRNAIDRARPAAGRAADHRRAAELLATELGDQERVCAHLLQAEPSGDPWVVEQLRAGAARASERGAPASAAAYLARALQEPAPPAARFAVTLGLGATQALLGRPECIDTLQEAMTLAHAPADRATAAMALAQVLAFVADIVRAVELLQRAVEGFDEAGLEGPALAAEAELLNTALLDTRTAPVARVAAGRLRARVERPGRRADHDAFSALACLAAMEGAGAAAVEQLARPITDGVAAQQDAADSPVRFVAAYALMFVDCFDAAAQVIDAAARHAQARGSDVGLVMARLLQSHFSYRVGAVTSAELDAREALGVSDVLPATVSTVGAAFLADALLERGAVEEAAAIAEGVPIGPEHAGAFGHVLHTRGRIRAARGQFAEAIADLRDCGRRMEATGVRNPGTIPWRSALAEALVGAGEIEEARAQAYAEIELARRSAGPRTLGMSLMAAGRCHRGPEAVECYRQAVAVLGTSAAALEHARALVALGTELSRGNARPEARQTLREGLDLALRCGATALVGRARDELLAAGGRPRRERFTGVAALTASELRVARLVAEGRSNREVAQALFVTRKTVEKHLASVFAKLSVSGRNELAGALEQAS
jgi:DNA-binding CsgD family transcriptional regulator